MSRDIKYDEIRDAVQTLAAIAAYNLPQDVIIGLHKALACETAEAAKEALRGILKNAEIAARGEYPLCQDTGTAVVFVQIGQEVRIKGGLLADAITDGVRRAYKVSYLRKSMVAFPYSSRLNTKDNTPVIIHTELVGGDKINLRFMAKGGGSENNTRLIMLNPSDGREGIIKSVSQTVRQAGGSPCPPLVIGIGIGGNAESAIIMSKKALLRPVGEQATNLEDAALEKDILHEVNQTKVGPLGFGGETSAMAVHILSSPCHMASLPLGISLGCHSARHAEVVL